MKVERYLLIFVPSKNGEYLISRRKCNKVVIYGKWDDNFALSKMQEIKGIAYKIIYNAEVISEYFKY